MIRSHESFIQNNIYNCMHVIIVIDLIQIITAQGKINMLQM